MKAERKNVESDLAVDVFFSNLVAGRDGLVPEIGQDGRWWIGGRDTGVVARGLTPEIGANGNWWIGGVDTGKPSRYEIPATEKMPKGAIILWNGPVNGIPDGWALCNGEAGTPNLSGKFIVGYDSGNPGYNTLGDTGGTSENTLKISQIPEHVHFNGVRDAKFQTFQRGWERKDEFMGFPVLTDVWEEGGLYEGYTSSIIRDSSNVAPVENRPPYYVLAYIIKL